MTKDDFASLMNLIGKMITYRMNPTKSNEREYLDEYSYVEMLLCDRDHAND